MVLGYISCKPPSTNGLPWPSHVLGSQTWKDVLLSFMAGLHRPGVPGQGNWATSSTAGLPKDRQILWMHPREPGFPLPELASAGGPSQECCYFLFYGWHMQGWTCHGELNNGSCASTSYLCSDRQTLWSQNRQAVPSSSTAGLVWPERPWETSPVKLHLALPPHTSANLNKPWGACQETLYPPFSTAMLHRNGQA